MDTYSIIFSGEAASGRDISQVKQNLAKLYKVPVAKLEPWFSGENIVIQRNCDHTKALQFFGGKNEEVCHLIVTGQVLLRDKTCKSDEVVQPSISYDILEFLG